MIYLKQQLTIKSDFDWHTIKEWLQCIGNHKDYRSLWKDKSCHETLTDAERLFLSVLQRLVSTLTRILTWKTAGRVAWRWRTLISQCSLVLELMEEIRTTEPAKEAKGRHSAIKSGTLPQRNEPLIEEAGDSDQAGKNLKVLRSQEDGLLPFHWYVVWLQCIKKAIESIGSFGFISTIHQRNRSFCTC